MTLPVVFFRIFKFAPFKPKSWISICSIATECCALLKWLLQTESNLWSSQVLHNGEEEDNVEGGEVEDGKGEEDVEGGEEEGGEEEDDVEAPFEYEIVTKTTITGKKTHVIYVGDNKYLSRGIKKNGRAFFYCNFVSVHHFI